MEFCCMSLRQEESPSPSKLSVITIVPDKYGDQRSNMSEQLPTWSHRFFGSRTIMKKVMQTRSPQQGPIMDVDYYFTLLLQGADGPTAHNKEQIDPAIQSVLYEMTRLSVESVLNFQNNHVILPDESSLSNRTVNVLLLKTSMTPFCRNAIVANLLLPRKSADTKLSLYHGIMASNDNQQRGLHYRFLRAINHHYAQRKTVAGLPWSRWSTATNKAQAFVTHVLHS